MRIKLRNGMEISISEGNMKVGTTPSFSTTPVVSCRKDVPCKKACYALKAYRLYTNTRTALDGNTMAILSGNLTRRYIAEKIIQYIKLKDVKYFRFSVSGDFNLPNYFDMAVSIARRCPNTKFLAYTKLYDIEKEYRERIRKRIPENLKVIYSVWNEYGPEDAGDYTDRSYAFFYEEGVTKLPEKPCKYVCPGKCETCRLCWNLTKGESVIFKKH